MATTTTTSSTNDTTTDTGTNPQSGSSPASIFNAYYAAIFQSAGAVAGSAANAQVAGSTALQAATNSGITQLYTLCAAATARAVAVIADSVVPAVPQKPQPQQAPADAA